ETVKGLGQQQQNTPTPEIADRADSGRIELDFRAIETGETSSLVQRRRKSQASPGRQIPWWGWAVGGAIIGLIALVVIIAIVLKGANSPPEQAPPASPEFRRSTAS
ncbi:MAG: hypothetical protein QGG36_30160, partial [Pirellulaceae bacterium]|nr:hypothetical protein [Pirellulaceae bacterium]